MIDGEPAVRNLTVGTVAAAPFAVCFAIAMVPIRELIPI
jgi:hypothetical protein